MRGTCASRFVNTDRYPIQDLGSTEAIALVESSRKQMEKTGALELPEFLSSEGLTAILKECAVIEPQAYWSRVNGNAYLTPTDTTVDEDHPLRMTDDTALAVVAYDQFPATSPLRQLYEWNPLMQFIGAVLDLNEIYRYADPMGGLNLAVMRDGDYLRWHFDQTDFVTTIALQTAERGGEFEYVPKVRGPGRENYDQVRLALKGDHPGVVTIENAPGSLVLFQGRYSLHRVKPIYGNRSRWIALLGYDREPGVMSTDHLRKMRYGRVK